MVEEGADRVARSRLHRAVLRSLARARDGHALVSGAQGDRWPGPWHRRLLDPVRRSGPRPRVLLGEMPRARRAHARLSALERAGPLTGAVPARSEEHTSELQPL